MIPLKQIVLPAIAGLFVFVTNVQAMTQEAPKDESIRPFHFHASDKALVDLHRRIAATKWPSKELVADASQGVQLATMQKLAQYWGITLYWLTNTGVSAARLYWETLHNVPLRDIAFFAPTGVAIPVAVSAFPDEIYQAPKSWTEQAYPKLIYYNRLPKGGHFAAWEQPEIFTAEMRAAFRSLR